MVGFRRESLGHITHHRVGTTAENGHNLLGLNLFETQLEAFVNVIALGLIANQDAEAVGFIIDAIHVHRGGVIQ
ncbi:MAG: hypothetical protein ACKOCA_11465 [Vulcanococcus sp.]